MSEQPATAAGRDMRERTALAASALNSILRERGVTEYDLKSWAPSLDEILAIEAEAAARDPEAVRLLREIDAFWTRIGLDAPTGLHAKVRAALAASPEPAEGLDVERVGPNDAWPESMSDGLSLACSDCGDVPRFDHRVSEEFWRRWVPDAARLGVVCLPCLDRRCGGMGLVESLEQVDWTGTGHTIRLTPVRRIDYSVKDGSQ